MKVSIISNFHEDAAVSRSEMVRKYFENRGLDYELLYSNFSHSLKKFRKVDQAGTHAIRTVSYKSNLSIIRFVSHTIFAFKVFIHLIKGKADLIYLILPPNILSLIVLGMYRKSPNLIVDVIDLWPEAFPMNKSFIKQSILFLPSLVSRLIRKMVINRSDFCITESSYFFDKLNLQNKVNSSVIYLKKFQNKSLELACQSEEFTVAYLGNIGNIYDFESLFVILNEIAKIRKCHLHVIGDGPRKNWFFKELEMKSIGYTYHGASFSEDLKYAVLPQCWFGFNGYIEDTEVALSYKSVDYLSYGVPLLNSAKFDTYNLVNKNEIGFNFSKENLSVIIDNLSIIDASEVAKLKVNAYNAFINLFSGESLFLELDVILSKLNYNK
jgi:hypothetical protein